MALKLWQVDAFAEKPFAGNPAAVVALEHWPADPVLQAIANENNLSETAFLVKLGDGMYDLRWFTPTHEVPLCGHATLASGWVVLNELEPSLKTVRFVAKSGVLIVERGTEGRYAMALPAGFSAPFSVPDGFAEKLGKALGVEAPAEIHIAPNGGGGLPALLALWPSAERVRAIRLSGELADMLPRLGTHAIIATAKGDAPYDFVSRFFAPNLGVPEDPVTGSAHCTLTTFWSRRLGKTILRAYQASARGGDILCTDNKERVILSGSCALYLQGEITADLGE